MILKNLTHLQPIWLFKDSRASALFLVARFSGHKSLAAAVRRTSRPFHGADGADALQRIGQHWSVSHQVLLYRLRGRVRRTIIYRTRLIPELACFLKRDYSGSRLPNRFFKQCVLSFFGHQPFQMRSGRALLDRALISSSTTSI